MEKRNDGKKVSNRQREEILRRSREGGKGNLQKEIARDMKLSPDTVRAIEAQAGLRRNPGHVVSAAEEKAIVSLMMENHGQPYISEALKIPVGAVREIMTKYRHRQARGATGHQYYFSKLELRAIKRDLREARRAVARKWKVTVPWVKEVEAIGRQTYRNAEPAPFLPKVEDLLRLLRALLPTGIPFDSRRDPAAVEGLMQGVSTFISLPAQYADGLRSRFGVALSELRRERNGEWIH